MTWFNKLSNSADIKKLKTLEKAIYEYKIPIEQNEYSELLIRVSDSTDKNAVLILKNIVKGANEFLVKYKLAGLYNQPGAWILEANAQGIIRQAQSAIDKINQGK